MKKILVVDDSAETRALINYTLSHENFCVVEASNGEEVMSKAIQEKPDLILLDIMMPELDGYSLSLKLKENSTTKNIPIIVISAKYGLSDLFTLNEISQVKDFIEKPFLPKTLLERIKCILPDENK